MAEPKPRLSPHGNFMPIDTPTGGSFDPTATPWFILGKRGLETAGTMAGKRRPGPTGGKGKGANKIYSKARIDRRLNQVMRDIEKAWSAHDVTTAQLVISRIRDKL